MRGKLAASPCCKQMVKKGEKGKKRMPTERIFCLHRAQDSRARLDYNPSYVFISALLARSCSAWLSSSDYCSKVHHLLTRRQEKPCHLAKQTHENNMVATGF